MGGKKRKSWLCVVLLLSDALFLLALGTLGQVKHLFTPFFFSFPIK